jgi:hypothetical protein
MAPIDNTNLILIMPSFFIVSRSCRIKSLCAPNWIEPPRLVSKFSANKLIGAKPMDHSAGRRASERANFVEGNLRLGVYRATADAQRFRDK